MRFLENYNRKKLENPEYDLENRAQEIRIESKQKPTTKEEYDVEIEEWKRALEKLEMVRKISNSSMYDAAIASVLEKIAALEAAKAELKTK